MGRDVSDAGRRKIWLRRKRRISENMIPSGVAAAQLLTKKEKEDKKKMRRMTADENGFAKQMSERGKNAMGLR